MQQGKIIPASFSDFLNRKHMFTFVHGEHILYASSFHMVDSIYAIWLCKWNINFPCINISYQGCLWPSVIHMHVIFGPIRKNMECNIILLCTQ